MPRGYDRRTFLRVGAASGLGGLAGCTGVASDALAFGDDADWPMAGVDAANTGYTPVRGPVSGLSERWRVKVPSDFTPEIVVADGVVYASCLDGTIYAFDAVTGTEIWRFDIGEEGLKMPAVANGLVYVAARGGRFNPQEYNQDPPAKKIVVAIDAESGTEVWRTELAKSRAPVTAPTVVDGSVYVGATRHGVYALDGESGEKQWQTLIYGGAHGTPAVEDGTLYIASASDRDWLDVPPGEMSVYALDAATGEPEWYTPLNGLLSGCLMVDDEMVYYTSYSRGGGTSAVDRATGEQRWHNPAVGGRGVTPALANGSLYLNGLSDEGVYGLDATTGRVEWHQDTEAVISPCYVANETVYTGELGRGLYALDATSGAVRWQHSIELGRHQWMGMGAIADGRLFAPSYVGCGSSTIVAFDDA